MKLLRSAERSLFLGCGVLVSVVLGYAQAARPQVHTAESAAAVPAPRAFVDQYCVGCHNERTKTAGLLLDKMEVSHVGDNAETWEKVVRKLRSGMMPPSGARRPDRTTADTF